MKISFRFPQTPASEATRYRRRRALMLASVGIAVLPLAWRGTSCGHDFDFHLETWMEVLRHWHEGVFYPHWATSANYGAGEPRFAFYPPASWMLGGALGALLPWTWVPLLFTLFVLRAATMSFFEMACEWMPEDNAAFAACLYVLNPYMLFVAYERSAYAEMLAAVWMPLLVLYALRDRPSVPQLALAIAMLWLTNAPAAVMGCYALALIVLWAVVVNRKTWLIKRTVVATVLGLGLASFYLVPALFEQRWVEISRAVDSGMRIEDSFLFEHTGQAFHDQVLHTASWIAIALLTFTAVAALLSLRYRMRAKIRGPLLFLAAAIACLLLPFSDAVWRHAPELKFLQFPWRWLLVLGVIGATLAGLCLRGEAHTRRNISMRAAAILLLACGMAAVSSVYFWNACDDEDNVRAQVATFHDGGFEGTDEYTAASADNDEIQQDLPQVRVLRTLAGDTGDSSVTPNPEWAGNSPDSLPAQVQIQRWDEEHIRLRIQSATAGFAVLRLMDYPAWRIRLNNHRMYARPHREDGLMALPVEAGRSTIQIDYGTTHDMWLGRLLSLIALIFWMISRAAQLGLEYPQQVS